MELFVHDGDGNYSPAKDSAVLDAARSAIQRKFKRGAAIDSPAAARKLLPSLLGGLEHELFCVAYLDKRHKLILFKEMFQGTIDGAAVYPREIVKQCLAVNAAALVLVHNHPSGDPTASKPDEVLTQRLKEALQLIDVRVLDHCIVGGNEVYSMAERGQL